MTTAAYPFVCNATIESAEITFERGFILTAMVHVSMSSSAQGFGGYSLGGSPFDDRSLVARHAEQSNLAADFIGGVMAIADVERWSHLKGKVIRVGKSDEWGEIIAIGHPVKDRWYAPKERMELLARDPEAPRRASRQSPWSHP